MHLWWSYVPLFIRMPGESHRRWFRSLLLYLCYVFPRPVSSIVCWFCDITVALFDVVYIKSGPMYSCLLKSKNCTVCMHVFVSVSHYRYPCLFDVDCSLSYFWFVCTVFVLVLHYKHGVCVSYYLHYGELLHVHLVCVVSFRPSTSYCV